MRPEKHRNIAAAPRFCWFQPTGELPTETEDESLILHEDEYEALRLHLQLDMYQEDAARQMQVSRQTFGRILKRAEKKIVEAIICHRVLQIGDNKCID